MMSEIYREKGHMKTETETGVRLSQDKEHSGLPETRVGKRILPQRLRRETSSVNTLISDF